MWISLLKSRGEAVSAPLQAALSFRPDGEAKLQDLRRRHQSLCDDSGGSLDESTKRELHDAVDRTEEQWRKVVQAAEEAEAEAVADRDVEALKTEGEALQRWIKEQRQKLLALGSHVEFETRMQTAQVKLSLSLGCRAQGRPMTTSPVSSPSGCHGFQT